MTISQQLDTLETTGLIRLVQQFPELEYLFRHALVQDAAYASLLRSDRQAMHHSVAATLSQLYADHSEEIASVLGYHFELAGDARQAITHYVVAGDTATTAHAVIEAVNFYDRALALAAQETIDGDTYSHIYLSRGRALELNSQFEQALLNYQEMEAQGQQLERPEMVLAALAQQSQIYCTPNALYNPEMGETFCNNTLALARAQGDWATEAKLLWNLVNLYRLIGRYEEGGYGWGGIVSHITAA